LQRALPAEDSPIVPKKFHYTALVGAKGEEFSVAPLVGEDKGLACFDREECCHSGKTTEWIGQWVAGSGI